MKLVYFSRLVAIISVTSLVHNVPNLPSPSTATIRRRRGNTSGSKLEKISRMEEISKDEKSCQEAKHNIVTLKKLSDESTSTKSTQAAPTAPTNYSSPLTSISKNAFSVVKVAHCVKKGAPIFGTAVVANETLSLIGLYGCESLGFTAVRLIAAAGLTTGAAAAVEAIALGVNSLLNESGLENNSINQFFYMI